MGDVCIMLVMLWRERERRWDVFCRAGGAVTLPIQSSG